MSKRGGEWSEAEDTKLIQLVRAQQYKKGKQDHEAFKANWNDIAKEMKSRTAGGCQARWTVHLDPTVDRSPWTPELDRQLLSLYSSKEFNSWSKRAKKLAEGKFTADGLPMRRGGADTCDRYFFLTKQKNGKSAASTKNVEAVIKEEKVEVKVEKGIKREREIKVEDTHDSKAVAKKTRK